MSKRHEEREGFNLPVFVSALVIVFVLTACAPDAVLPTPTTRPTSTVAPTLSSELYQARDDIDGAFCPPPRGWFTYRVQPGDTLPDIADRSGSSIGELAAANCLNNPRLIAAGTELYVPRRIG